MSFENLQNNNDAVFFLSQKTATLTVWAYLTIKRVWTNTQTYRQTDIATTRLNLPWGQIGENKAI